MSYCITNELLKFPSIYRASKDMNVNPGLISFYVNKGKEIKINGEKYTVKKLF